MRTAAWLNKKYMTLHLATSEPFADEVRAELMPLCDQEAAEAELARLREENGVLRTWINVALVPLQAVADLEDFEDGGEGMNALIAAGRRLGA